MKSSILSCIVLTAGEHVLILAWMRFSVTYLEMNQFMWLLAWEAAAVSKILLYPTPDRLKKEVKFFHKDLLFHFRSINPLSLCVYWKMWSTRGQGQLWKPETEEESVRCLLIMLLTWVISTHSGAPHCLLCPVVWHLYQIHNNLCNMLRSAL